MRISLSLPQGILIATLLLAVGFTPLIVTQIQQEQILTQHADEVQWFTGQSALASCNTAGTSVIITVSFSNTEANKSSTAMNVTAVDQQTGKSVNMGSIAGGQTKNAVIQTGKTSLKAGTVNFNLSWTDGHAGTDTRTAGYSAVTSCTRPTPSPSPRPSPTPKNSPTPTIPSPSNILTPTPTICPSLSPVKNVHIVCPNCQ